MLLSEQDMYSRTYNLRTRTNARAASPRSMATRPDSGALVSLYSDVAASRPPSPRKELERSPEEPAEPRSEHPSEEVDSEGAFGYSRNDQTAANQNVEPGENVLSEGNDSHQHPGEQPWIKVTRRRARSLDSVTRAPPVSREHDTRKNTLTTEQARTVQTAEGALTAEQSELVRRRYDNTALRPEKSLSRGEGPSRSKGKGRDLRNWGNVPLEPEELDLEVQAAALESFSRRKDQLETNNNGYRSAKSHKKHRAHHSNRHEHRAQPAESRPAAQIAKNSYLGMALQNVGRRRRASRRDGSPSPSDSSSSDDSDFTTSSSESESSLDTREPNEGPSRSHARRGNRHGRNKKRRRSSSGSSKPSSSLKPIPPLEYDGKPDARSYHRFVRESEAYLRDGRVRGRRKVFLLSYYLSGRAYDFYTQKVAIDEESWSLPEFYAELFNYCFPVDFRMQMRRNLARCHQNESTVAEYVHELQELFNMIGDISERDKVLKFWNGSRAIIQKGLWRDNLNPEISTWEQVVAQAEII